MSRLHTIAGIIGEYHSDLYCVPGHGRRLTKIYQAGASHGFGRNSWSVRLAPNEPDDRRARENYASTLTKFTAEAVNWLAGVIRPCTLTR